MDLPSALLDGLFQLGQADELDGDQLETVFADLVAAIRTAVPSYRGLVITIMDGAQPVQLVDLTSTDDRPIVTSLRLPFSRLDHGSGSAGHIVFWAAQPGAFVDLAADLGYALKPPAVDHHEPPTTNVPIDDGLAHKRHDTYDGDGDASIRMDVDLPLHDPTPGLSGLDQLSTINRAIGILIGQGHDPDEALGLLHREAAAAGVEPHVYAAGLLRR